MLGCNFLISLCLCRIQLDLMKLVARLIRIHSCRMRRANGNTYASANLGGPSAPCRRHAREYLHDQLEWGRDSVEQVADGGDARDFFEGNFPVLPGNGAEQPQAMDGYKPRTLSFDSCGTVPRASRTGGAGGTKIEFTIRNQWTRG